MSSDADLYAEDSADVLARARAALGSGRGLADVDLDDVPQGELRAWGEALGRMRRELDLMLAKVASAQARRSTKEDGPAGMARRNGKPSPRGLVAGQTGGSEYDAGRLIDVGEILDEARPGEGANVDAAAPDSPAEEGRTGALENEGPRFRVLPAAVEAAEVSIEAASMISRMLKGVFSGADAEAWLSAERELVAKAKLLSLKQLSRVVRQVEARLDRSGVEARERVQHEARYLHVIEEASGMVKIAGMLDIETAAPIKAVLDAIVDKGLKGKRDTTALTPDERTVPQMRADALAVLARHMLGCDDQAVPRGGATLVVRATADDAHDRIDAPGRGDGGDGVASVDGFGQPVSAAAARRMIGDGKRVVVTLTAKGAVLDLGRDNRFFSWEQRLALVERDGGCAMCTAPPSWCQAHHIREWVKHSGRSDLDNGVLLCTRCHQDVHHQGWIIEPTATEVWFIPPASIDPQRRRRPGGRMLHDSIPLTPDALEELERAGADAVGAAESRRRSATGASEPRGDQGGLDLAGLSTDGLSTDGEDSQPERSATALCASSSGVVAVRPAASAIAARPAGFAVAGPSVDAARKVQAAADPRCPSVLEDRLLAHFDARRRNKPACWSARTHASG